MAAYADDIFYHHNYLPFDGAPVIPPGVFEFYARKASAYIRQYTLDNIGEDVPEAVKMCCCELAEILYNQQHTKAAQGIASEKVGDASVSYESAESQRQALPKTIKSVVYSWLADTGLLYRGGGLC
jgi:hypothetical protein